MVIFRSGTLQPESVEASTLVPLMWALRDEQSQWRNRLPHKSRTSGATGYLTRTEVRRFSFASGHGRREMRPIAVALEKKLKR